MKKYKLKIKYIPTTYGEFGQPEHYIVKRKYIGLFWLTIKCFYQNLPFDLKSLEQSKSKALHYMNNYCQVLKNKKENKLYYKARAFEQRKWEKSETVHKTCECETK